MANQVRVETFIYFCEGPSPLLLASPDIAKEIISGPLSELLQNSPQGFFECAACEGAIAKKLGKVDGIRLQA